MPFNDPIMLERYPGALRECVEELEVLEQRLRDLNQLPADPQADPQDEALIQDDPGEQLEPGDTGEPEAGAPGSGASPRERWPRRTSKAW